MQDKLQEDYTAEYVDVEGFTMKNDGRNRVLDPVVGHR